MNLLTHDLKDIVQDRIKVGFDTDFRTSILFELLMQREDIKIKLKIRKTLELYYPDLSQITDLEMALKDIMWFYQCGKEKKTSHKNKKINNGKKDYIYSYEYDAEYIYSAFMQQYNIDLTEIEYLHWWKFRALFEGLNKDTKIVEIMGYRAMDLSKIKDKKEKKFYKKMKELYALPDMRTTLQKEQDFAYNFW